MKSFKFELFNLSNGQAAGRLLPPEAAGWLSGCVSIDPGWPGGVGTPVPDMVSACKQVKLRV